MHLGNGIICPATGIPTLAIAGAAIYFAFKKARIDFTKDKILPLIALTAFVFAIQMINFSIPQTGSSGHIIGAVLLSVLVGPFLAFLSVCAVLAVQALFFADGGLLSLGCNIINMGVLACFVAYPFIYKPLKEKNREYCGIILASFAALQLGAFAVVVEGVLSGSISASKFAEFALLMQGIHIPVGIIEGLAGACILFVLKKTGIKAVSTSLGALSIILAGFISNYASKNPDGLEWSLLKISDFVIYRTNNVLYQAAQNLQDKLSVSSFSPVGEICGIILICAVMAAICLFLNKKERKSGI